MAPNIAFVRTDIVKSVTTDNQTPIPGLLKMTVILTALSKVLPIFLLILLGVLLRRRQFISWGTVEDIKKLVVNVTLPAVLVLAFAQVTIEPQYLLIVLIMFAACVLVLVLGRYLGSPLRITSSYMPSLLTGFEAGMMGYAIFGAVYGQESIYKFGIVDLGQVLFVFFVLVPGLERMSAGSASLRATAISFIKTPVILAILGGLLFKQTGLIDAVSVLHAHKQRFRDTRNDW